MRTELESLAAALAQAWKTGVAIPDPVGAARPATRAEAYQVQDRMAELIGGRVGGWKIGAALKAVQVAEGHDGPIPGRLFADRIHLDGAELPWALYAGSKAEIEYAFRLKRALPPRAAPYTRAELEPLFDLVMGIEIAGSRLKGDTPGVRSLLTIADNGGGSAFVFGRPIPDWTKLDLDALPLSAELPGKPARIYSGEQRGDVVEVAVEMVNAILERGAPLAEGDYLSTGSLCWPLPLERGQTFTARFGDLATLTVRLD